MRLKSLVVAGLLILAPLAGICQHWRMTGSMLMPRRILPMAVLPNNTVLAAGGYATTGYPTWECELFDVASATWRTGPPMLRARARHVLLPLPDGRVLAIAGQDANLDDASAHQTAIVDIYDPATNTWSAVGALREARQNHTATLMLDGKLLVAGGWSSNMSLADCEIYDPATGTSRMVAPMIQRRHDHQALLLASGEVLVAGGRTGGSGSQYLSEVEIYDPSTNNWRQVQSMHQPRVKGSLALFADGSVLAAGGRNTPSSSAPGSELFDPSTQQWNLTDPMLEPCVWQGETMLPFDQYMITGGIVDAEWSTSTNVTVTRRCEWYAKFLNRWFYTPSLVQARGEHGTVFFHQTVNQDLPEFVLLVANGLTGPSQYTTSCEYLDVCSEALQNYQDNQATLAAVNAPATPPIDLGIRVEHNASAVPAIMLDTRAAGRVRLQVSSATGVAVVSADVDPTANASIDLRDLPSGLYVVRAAQGAASATARVLVVR